MADNAIFQTSTPTYPPTNLKVSADDASDSSGLMQRVKLCYSADGDVTHVTADASGLLVQLASVPSHAVTNAGTFAVQAAQSGTWNVGTVTTVSTVTAVTTVGSITNAVAVTDNSGSLTVDAPVGTPVFVRLSDGAAAISTLPVSLASVPSHAVTNAGTFAVQVDGSALTSLQLIDDVIFTDDTAYTPATSKLAVIGAQADESSTDSVDEGDAGALRMTLDRKLHVTNERETAKIRVAGTATTPLFAAISASSSGNNAIVAADATKKIRVLKWSVSASGAVNVKWRSASTDITGLFYLPQYGVACGALCELGHFETVANEALNLNLSGATAVGGYVVYVLV